MVTCAISILRRRHRDPNTEEAPKTMAEQSYANPAALVSTQWVADHLDDPSVRLIEVDVDTSAYGQGHIQGAVGVNWPPQRGDPIRRDIPSRDAWGKLLSD